MSSSSSRTPEAKKEEKSGNFFSNVAKTLSKLKPTPKAKFQKGDLVRRNHERQPYTLDWRISVSEYDSYNECWFHKIEPYYRQENNHKKWPHKVPEKDKQWIVEERLKKEEEMPLKPDEGAS